MPLCPKCGEYYVRTCGACGYSAVDDIDHISRGSRTTQPKETDKKELILSLERRRVYDLLSKTSEKFTVRQIATKTQISESTVKKTLAELSNGGYLLSVQASSGVFLYRLTEAGYSRFRYSSETLEGWTPPKDKMKLYNVLTTVTEPVTIREILRRSGASEYLVRKTIKSLEQHGEAICEDRAARPRKYTIKPGSFVESLLEP